MLWGHARDDPQCVKAAGLLWGMHDAPQRVKHADPRVVWSAAQDERELKRARRKQSNRESARRSRLRKQAECEGLASKVTGLEAENARLKEEVRLLQAQLAAALAAKAQ